jgi:hypothetical protein
MTVFEVRSHEPDDSAAPMVRISAGLKKSAAPTVVTTIGFRPANALDSWHGRFWHDFTEDPSLAVGTTVTFTISPTQEA